MERGWIDMVLQRAGGGAEEYEEGFRLGPDQTLAEALAELDAVAATTEAGRAGHVARRAGPGAKGRAVVPG